MARFVAILFGATLALLGAIPLLGARRALDAGPLTGVTTIAVAAMIVACGCYVACLGIARRIVLPFASLIVGIGVPFLIKAVALAAVSYSEGHAVAASRLSADPVGRDVIGVGLDFVLVDSAFPGGHILIHLSQRNAHVEVVAGGLGAR